MKRKDQKGERGDEKAKYLSVAYQSNTADINSVDTNAGILGQRGVEWVLSMVLDISLSSRLLVSLPNVV